MLQMLDLLKSLRLGRNWTKESLATPFLIFTLQLRMVIIFSFLADQLSYAGSGLHPKSNLVGFLGSISL